MLRVEVTDVEAMKHGGGVDSDTLSSSVVRDEHSYAGRLALAGRGGEERITRRTTIRHRDTSVCSESVQFRPAVIKGERHRR